MTTYPENQSEAEQKKELLTAAYFRTTEEGKVLARGAAFGVGILAVALLIILPLYPHIPAPANLSILLVVLAWIFGPYIWAVWLAVRENQRWAGRIVTTPKPPPGVKRPLRAPQVEPFGFPPSRMNLQRFLHTVSRRLALPVEPLLILVDGPETITLIAGRRIVSRAVYPSLAGQEAHQTITCVIAIPIALYNQTRDEEMEVMLLHELGHVLAGHHWLLPLSRVAALADFDVWRRVLILPALLTFSALREWGWFADATADRFLYVARPNTDLAIRLVLKQALVPAQDQETYGLLIHHLQAGTSPHDHGERMSFQALIDKFLRERPYAEVRVDNLRAWRKSDACREATAILWDTPPPPEEF